ncbi:hypothetical protein TVAG_153270 [Trichomonas vaginalis G3]|uniref:Uncharacterized protein n=1 Tax=Trichomonas vaginalis (strain ATCC PRA-98 / G3) TaxID=412133 RepID=A2FYY1_TRIV3|nr:transmembrane protein family [Trichomonas vaginalis G3]EAX89882.1 hypothetical protein TVAG_153270 [Trichomonas vaginalis G3]KAI5518458.1 transmembrane protein family [Trichomonas vaginalis G3]|eukprot:XP_001302812.1 hypothetical protein [Trichomonas vaginalis G3]
MLQLSRTLFPFRVLAFSAIYITVNVILYTLDSDYGGEANIVKNYYSARFSNSNLSPNLPDFIKSAISRTLSSNEMIADATTELRIWLIFADIFLVFLFISLIFGIVTTVAHLSFIEGVLHLIGVILMSHALFQNAHRNFVICGVFFGIMLPFLMELWQLISIFVFKTDFY